MIFDKKHTGFAIAIAWPETWCKQSGAWYDNFINRLGISKHHYYRVGHAALVLVDSANGKCHYFDFGRYHTPFQHGRVRSEKTDDGLKMNTVARISSNGLKIENFEEILIELQMNPECHGEGSIHASYSAINFEKAYEKATLLQQISPIRYGPFRYGGSNCSRFLNTTLLAGNPGWKAVFKLNFLVPLTPTPLNNVNSFANKTVLPKLLPFAAFSPAPVTDKSKLTGTLPQPVRPAKIPQNAQWLSGEGAGSWFSVNPADDEKFEITRFSPEGKVECKGIFAVSENKSFNLENPYKIDYLSHCRKVTIIQSNIQINLKRIKGHSTTITKEWYIAISKKSKIKTNKVAV